MPKQLTFGGLKVDCLKTGGDWQSDIPLGCMAFYHPENDKPDMVFNLGIVEPEEQEKLLFGSDDYASPTYIYQNKSGSFEWVTRKPSGEPGLGFRISPDWSECTLYEDKTGTGGADAFRECGSMFAYAALKHHACVLHGVVMEYQGKGVLFTAASGVGKTTHTRMWRDMENALILNGDRCLCRKVDGKWYAYGMPWAGSSGEYINRRVPLSLIVELERGKDNVIMPVTPFEGTLGLMQHVFAPAWPGKLQNAGFDCCDELAREIPILRYACRPEPESVKVLKKTVEAI